MASRPLRKTLTLATAYLLVLIVAACGTTAPKVTPPTSEGASSEELPTIKIGAAVPFTSEIADGAKEMREAFDMYVDQHHGTLGGLPVKMLWEDTEGDAGIAVAKVKKLIDTDKVNLLTQGGFAFESLAYSNTVKETQIPFVGWVAADELSRANNPYTLGVAKHTASQEGMPLGTYSHDELGYKKAAIIAQDSQWGWQVSGGFQYAFEAAGGTVVSKSFVQTGTSDYGPIVTEIPRDIDVVFAVITGSDVPRFVQAYNDYGLKSTIPLMGSEDVVGSDATRYFNDDAEGIRGITPFSPAIDRPEMRSFVQAYTARTGQEPSFWGEGAYVNALAIDRMLWYARDKLGIDPKDLPTWVRENGLEFLATARSIKLSDTPSSPVTIDDGGWAQRNFYVVKLVKDKDGNITNEVEHTIPNVGRFWEFNKSEFLSLPLFSRTFPTTSH
ncbi:ABC transporter substrate-binding protein (plasmid) [Rhodococcus globerulus]|uniref:ABC transporter substrate-binding protein n=1 Tax=Rhodococcus globerulus TaxID=33008 RepID=UPI0039EADA48